MTMHDLLTELHCPYCGSGLEREAEFSVAGTSDSYGIVRCACYRYPIIAGILVLRQMSGAADTCNKAVEFIEKSDPEGALRYAFNYMTTVPLPRKTNLQRLVSSLKHRSSLARKLVRLEMVDALRSVRDGSLTFQQAVALLRPSRYSHYLFHRYANNSFLASIATLSLLEELDSVDYSTGQPLSDDGTTHACKKETRWMNQEGCSGKRRVLDLACGMGHSSFLMTSLFPNVSVIAADHDFVNLYIARRYLIPGVTSVCLDAEIPLPFADHSLDAVFCLDGFHYIRSKVALLSELDRVLQPFALWLFPHLHNASAQNFAAGIPLSYDDYSRCFEFIQPRILSEAELFRSLMMDQSVDLGVAPPSSDVRKADVFTLIGSRRTDLWRKHTKIAALLRHQDSPLGINPIYQVTDQHKTLRLEMHWPDSTLEAECAPIKKYLPVECQVDKSLLDRVRKGALREEDETTIQELLNSFVLVRLPRGYGNCTVQ